MFERYTEKARRVIFFARYEACQFGAQAIEAEHILLGVLREDKVLVQGLFRRSDIDAIRNEIAAHSGTDSKIPESVDLPLSPSAKRVLSYAADDSEKLGHRHIGTEHLMLGLIKEERSFAGELLRERGITADRVLACVHVEKPLTPGTTEPAPHQLGQQLKALVDRLAQKGVLAPEDVGDQLLGKDAALHFQASLSLLLDLLVSKGVITEDERREISTGQS